MENGILTKNGRVKAIAFLIATAVFWSMGGLLIKWVSWNPFAIAGMRSAIASLVFLVVLRRPKITWSLPQLGGTLSYAVTVIFFVLANKLTTAANAILLQYTAPIYVAVLGAWLLKERTKLLDWITIVIAAGGMVLFFLDDLTGGGMLGNIFAIISGMGFASVAIFMRKQKNESPFESIFLGNILTALIGLPFMFGPSPDLSGWIGLILLGIFQLGLSYVLYSFAIKHVTALEAILIPVIEPVLNPVWVFLVFGEIPGPWAFIGGFIVLATVTGRCVISAIQGNENQEKESGSHKVEIK